jgi:hypothetical protein
MSMTIELEAAPAAGAAATKDLSGAIEASIRREPQEEVRCVRVFGDNYRCNWWVRDPSPGPMYLNVGRIAKSRFFKATLAGGELVIEDGGDSRPQ